MKESVLVHMIFKMHEKFESLCLETLVVHNERVIDLSIVVKERH